MVLLHLSSNPWGLSGGPWIPFFPFRHTNGLAGFASNPGPTSVRPVMGELASLPGIAQVTGEQRRSRRWDVRRHRDGVYWGGDPRRGNLGPGRVGSCLIGSFHYK